MTLLALIPARGGSKGIPRKNIRNLHGKPLLAWTIEAAQAAETVDRIVVSTDDDEIADVARNWGAEVPFRRPESLALDDTSGIQPVLHALAELPETDWLLLLQPTSPLRRAADIDGIVHFCRSRGAESAVSVCDVAKHPYWMFDVDDQQRLQPFTNAPPISRRQDLPPVFVLNGALYLARSEWLRNQKSFVGPGTLGYRMPLERSADIDTLLDWEWIEFLMEKQRDN